MRKRGGRGRWRGRGNQERHERLNHHLYSGVSLLWIISEPQSMRSKTLIFVGVY